MMRSVTEIRTRYADTDQMKFVYNGKYFEFFEVGRTELLRDYGLSYKWVEEHGYYMPVREAHINYKNAAFYDEVLVIESVIPQLPAAICRIESTITSKERGVVICTGYIDLMFVNAATGRACRPPEFFVTAVRPYYE